MLDSGSASSCTSSVGSGATGTSGPVVAPSAQRLPARCPRLARLQGSRSPRLVFLSSQGIRRQYLGATTTTWGRCHHRNLHTFHYGGLRRRNLYARRHGSKEVSMAEIEDLK
jgi:hypothetical protein